MPTLQFSPMTAEEFALFWPTFQAIVAAQETYAIDPNITYDDAFSLWCKSPLKSLVVKDEQGQLLGSYYLKANAAGPGSHVCNCGYMVTPQARGKGVARAMCEHSQEEALSHGFKAMQFNAVVASNHIAVALWRRLGFSIVGTVPNAYLHASLGYVAAHIMHKTLTEY